MHKETVSIETLYIPLSALFKLAGVTDSGGAAKAILQEYEVLVNGQPCDQRGKKIYPGDTVEIVPNILIVVEKREHN